MKAIANTLRSLLALLLLQLTLLMSFTALLPGVVPVAHCVKKQPTTFNKAPANGEPSSPLWAICLEEETEEEDEDPAEEEEAQWFFINCSPVSFGPSPAVPFGFVSSFPVTQQSSYYFSDTSPPTLVAQHASL